MEIKITPLANTEEVDLMDYSASAMELGQSAGQITWNNALEAPFKLVTSEEEKQEARDFIRGFGAWEDAEIDGWNDTELNALVLQFVAGDLREYLWAKSLHADDFKRWNENHGGRIFEADGEFYYYLGN